MNAALKDFEALSQEEKFNIVNCIKNECEMEIAKPYNDALEKTLLDIVQSNGITYKSLYDSFKSVCNEYEYNFHGIDFPLEDYKEEYKSFCAGKLEARRSFLQYEIRDEYDLDDFYVC